ncbi:MAG: NAD(P)-dependent oxidoreductase [Acidimicrobiales bacterium]
MRIAVLGMGRMGHAVAGRLLDGGHEVTIWNRTAGRAGDLVARGAREADSVAAASVGAEVVITCLADDPAVAATALGDGGVRQSIGDGAVYADSSTISPALSRRLDQEFPRFAAMPILGSPAAVAGGDAGYLVGGTPEVAALLDPVLGSLAAVVHRFDKPTQASTAKLALNLLLLDGIVAVAESVTVCRSAGLTDDQVRGLLGPSSLVAPGLKNRFEGILTGTLDPWWTASLGAKDAGLAVDAVVAADGELPLTACARQRYLDAAASGLGDEDIVAVAALYRSAGGLTTR